MRWRQGSNRGCSVICSIFMGGRQCTTDRGAAHVAGAVTDLVFGDFLSPCSNPGRLFAQSIPPQRNVDLTIVRISHCGPSQTQSVSTPVSSCCWRGLFAGMWAYLEPRHLDPNAPGRNFGPWRSSRIRRVGLRHFGCCGAPTSYFGAPESKVPIIFLIRDLYFFLHDGASCCLVARRACRRMTNETVAPSRFVANCHGDLVSLGSGLGPAICRGAWWRN